VLWVDETYRNQGYGAKLIEEAEKIAKSMGCIMVMTSTFSYQAPGFYPKCGFETYAVLEGFPEGIKLYRFKKLL
jgi:GNAT superfamily N-acetyltransferase